MNNKCNERLQPHVTDAPRELRRLLENPDPDIDHVTAMLTNHQSPDMVNNIVDGATNLFYAIDAYQKSETDQRKVVWKEIIDLFISRPGCDPTKRCIMTYPQMTPLSLYPQMTPLMCAVQSGDLDLLKALVPLITIDQPQHLTEGFLLSCRKGHTEMAEYLLTNGADTKSLSIALAIQSGSVAVCQSLRASQKTYIVKRNTGVAPLLVAAKVSHSLTLYLMSIDGCELDPIGPQGTNVLIESVIGGIADNVKLFLGKGYNVNIKVQGGNTPLHFAVRAGHKHIIAILLEVGADINARNNLGQTALFEVKSTDEETLRVLLSYPECNANLTDDQGQLPLVKFIPKRSDDYAVLSCAKILLDQTSVEALSHQHKSTKHLMATALCHNEGGRMLIRLLLVRGCTPSIQNRQPHYFSYNSLRFSYGRQSTKKETVFEYLASQNRPEDADLMAMFIEKGVREFEPVATCKFELRQAIFNQKGNVESLLAAYKSLLLEIPSGDNANLRLIDRLMFEMLRECAVIKSDCAQILILFLNAGANPNVIDKNKCTPLSALLQLEMPAPLPVAKVLLGWKATTTTNKIQNYEYLRLVVENKHFDIGMYLVSDLRIDLDARESNSLVNLIARDISDLTRQGYGVNQFAITSLVQLADAIIIRSSENMDLQLIVEQCESPLINHLLLQHGASVNTAPIGLNTIPLVALCQDFSRESTRFFSRQRLRSIRAALDAGMDVNGGDTDGTYTPLMSACTNLWLDLVWLLMENGADTKRKCVGKTAFDMLNLSYPRSRMKMRRRIAKLLDPLYVPDGPVSIKEPMKLYDHWMEMGERADNDARCIDDESDKYSEEISDDYYDFYDDYDYYY